jgi:predicted pyridoxine 5'-phosphate oxidase superfamily flavin-nucleotide-binding protein
LAALPEIAAQAWENREGPVILSTVDSNGIPNTIYVTCVKKISDSQIVVADNKMHKTRANIKAGCAVSLLYITSEKKAFQLKGSVHYHTSARWSLTLKKYIAAPTSSLDVFCLGRL